MKDFTVAIPVYNGAKTLPQVLERLRDQTFTTTVQWEVLVIDNNSTDQTPQIVEGFQASWLPDVPLKYFRELRQGISYARQRAVTEAEGELIGFLDDDNFAAPNWVAAACAFGQTYPQAGAFGGEVRAAFEVPPAEDLADMARLLAIGNYADRPRRYEPEKLRLPAGAGLVVRRAAWQNSIPEQLTRVSRGGNDYEISLRLYRQGWEIWHTPTLQLDHYIPAQRVERVYLTQLAWLYGLCTCEIRMIIIPLWQKPLFLAKSFLGSLRRLILHLINSLLHQGSQGFQLQQSCKTAFLLGTVLSPFYYLRNRLFGQS
ncbi:MAG: hormogonium polysaccharide biosynthesis glycosyltransferase HpsE [Elainella sp.]